MPVCWPSGPDIIPTKPQRRKLSSAERASRRKAARRARSSRKRNR